MKFTMHFEPSPRSIAFSIAAHYPVSPPVQYLDDFCLTDVDTYDIEIEVFDYVVSRGWIALSDIITAADEILNLKSCQLRMPVCESMLMQEIVGPDAITLCMPIKKAIIMQGILKEG